MKKSEHIKPDFAQNQHVVYPIQGVGEIKAIEKKMFKNKDTLYYNIYFDASDMTIMVPVDKAIQIGIRKIVEKSESERALNILSEVDEPLTTDWKLRYQLNLDLMKKGSIGDIAKVVRSLYHRSKLKELPILERKLFDNALKLLIDEISYSLELNLDNDKREGEQLIFSRLETE